MQTLPLRPVPRSSLVGGWALGLGLALLPLVHAQGVLWQAHTVPKMALVRLAALLVAAAGGVALVRAHGSVRLSRAVLLAVAFLAWMALTSLTGVDVHQSLFGAVHRYEGLAGLAAYMVFFVAARTLAEKRGVLPPAAGAAACVVGGIVGVIGVAQAVWPAARPLNVFGLEALDRSASTFGNPIFLGLFAALVIPFGLASLAAWERTPARAAGAAGLGALAAAGYLTYSRGAWLGILAGVAVLGALGWRRRRRLLGPALVAAVVAAALVAGVSSAPDAGAPGGEDLTAGGRIEETFSGGGTVGTRVELYRGALALISERPLLGFGLETYASQAPRVRTLRLVQLESSTAFPDRPHNPQLYLAYAGGIPGLALYGALVVSALVGGLSGLRRADGPAATVRAGLLAGCAGYLAAELTSFSVVEVTPLFWAALGWASAGAAPAGAAPVGTASAEDRVSADRLRAGGLVLPRTVARAVGAVLLAGLVPAAFVLAGHTVRVAAADHIHSGIVTRVQDPARYREVEREEARATALDPYTPFYWNTRALVLSHAWSAGGPPGLLDEAETILRSGLERIPSDPTLTVTLSDVLLKAGRPREAAELLEMYIRTDPYLGDARFNLALAYLDLGDPAKAVTELRQAVLIAPGDAEAFWYLARALDAVGDGAGAAAARSRALELDPSLSGG